jgi:hypothetical protein
MDNSSNFGPCLSGEYLDGFKPRRSSRHIIDGETELTSTHPYNIEVSVRDLSAGGFMAECSEPVQIGSFVALDVPGVGRVNAQVRWQVGVRMGGMFLDPISLTQCEWTAVKAD